MFKTISAGLIGFALAGAVILGASADDNARIRVIHASPDAPAVDVYANGDEVLTNVPFGASSGYLEVPAGSYTFEIFAAGANPDSDDAVLTIETDLAAGTDYTALAINEVAEIEAAAFEDDNTAPASGQAHIYVVHAGPDAPAVDIAVAGGPVLMDDLSFGNRAGPLPVDAGTYDLEVRPAGTEDVALPLDGVTLEAGKIYTFVASGFLEGEPELTVLAFAEDPMTAPPATAPSDEARPMGPPSAGSGGLAGGSSGGSNVYLYGAAVLLTIIALAGVARRVAVRS